MLRRVEQGAFEQLADIAQLGPGAAEHLEREIAPFIEASRFAVSVWEQEQAWRNDVSAANVATSRVKLRFSELCLAASRYLESVRDENDTSGSLVAFVDGLSGDLTDAATAVPLLGNHMAALASVPVETPAPALDRRALQVVQDLAARALELPKGRIARERPPRSVGRPVGSTPRQTAALFELVGLLHTAITRHGGKLTFTEREPEAGSLWPALRTLAPLLPPGIVPLVCPASALRRACERWRGDLPSGK